MARRLLAIANPAAGGDDDETRKTVLSTLGEGADVVAAVVAGPEDLDRILDEHPGRDPVVLGGDGTLHRVVAALLARDEPARTVGLIPMGTGNDLARTLGIPLDPREAALVVLRGTERPLDVLVDDRGGIVINAVHVGVGALASEQAVPLKPALRRAAYAVGALLAGVRAKGWRLRVRVDGRLVADGRLLMVGVGNGASIGGGTPLAPGARPDDGVADVVISHAVSAWARLGYAVLLRLGRHRERHDVVTLKGRSIVVEGEPVPANADGELEPAAPYRSWTLRPAAWRVIAPDQQTGRQPDQQTVRGGG
ncbi:lipid kinase, YegS/Rv2252/BmrU family [Nonomuraea solani]|uniref:Lipid kinase, YegS/Rv2252/BmrU family n=1 Tax=Nonomuraea solani TaxID=1144553 RepID=A0A1H6E2P7_9ACTN|nr:diacylglycerol kinase family protein [Nonomuraea solani]SEG91890.1 lipid kinase, YegS/Rv2252/BmrU family [Nonomuraea solani]